MSRAHPDEASIVDVDASVVFRQPLLIVILVTGISGAIDAVGYRHLGVFTANQGGNLVIGSDTASRNSLRQRCLAFRLPVARVRPRCAAFSVAMLGMVFISGHGVRAPVLASTNAFVDAVRYGTAWTVDRSQGSWLRRARCAAAFPIAWSLGAATAAFSVGVVGRLPVTATASLVLVGIALFARRVSEAAPHPDRTV